MAEEAKVANQALVIALEAEVAVAPAGLPAVMADNALQAALRIGEVIRWEWQDQVDGVKANRLIYDACRGSVLDFVRAAGEEFKTRRASVLEGLLEELRAKRAASAAPPLDK